jgi:plasmid stabilization system protein ParE
MAVTIRLTSAACADLAKAHDWYERQSIGLGKEFLRSVEAALAFIERHPELLAPVYRHLRRVLTKRFPYAIYYENRDTNSVRVVAVLHTAMDTGRLRERTE